MTEDVNRMTEHIKDIVRAQPGVPGMEVLRMLEEQGHDPQEAAFAIAYAIKHGALELDGERRLRLVADGQSVPA